MKKVLLMLLLLFILFEVSSQQDPVVAALLKEIAALKLASNSRQQRMEITQKRMEILQHTIQKAKEKLDWIKNAEMIREINGLLESMICNQNDLDFYMGLNDSYGCLIQLDYDMILMEMSTSYNVLYLLLGAGLSMSSGERISNLMDVVALLRKTNEKITSFNGRIILGVNSAIQSRYMDKLFQENNSYSYSRYTPVRK